MEDSERTALFAFLSDAIEEVCCAGLLPRPLNPLPPFGTRVEAMLLGGKPGPKSKYGTGTVKKHSWDSVFQTWRVGVTCDEPAGYYYGQPIRGTSTFPHLVHVIGSDERPFSALARLS